VRHVLARLCVLHRNSKSDTISVMSRKVQSSLIGTVVVIVVVGLQSVEHWTLVDHAVEALKRQGPVGVFLAGVLMSRAFPLVLALGIIVIVIDMWRKQRELDELEKARPAEAGAVDARARREIYRIDWRYLPVSPLERGWKVAYQDWNPTPQVKFLAPLDAPEVGGLRIDVDKKYAIKFDIPTEYGNSSDDVALAIKYEKGAMFWIEVNVTTLDGVSGRESRLLKILVGDKPPESPKEWPMENFVWVIPDPLPNGWSDFRLRLPEIVTRAVGNRGYIYESIKAVQMRGCISVSPIKLLSSVPARLPGGNV
jgi:hypothetical protein